MDISGGECQAAAGAGPRFAGTYGQPDGPGLPWRGPRPRCSGSSAGEYVVVQPDISSFPGGECYYILVTHTVEENCYLRYYLKIWFNTFMCCEMYVFCKTPLLRVRKQTMPNLQRTSSGN